LAPQRAPPPWWQPQRLPLPPTPSRSCSHSMCGEGPDSHTTRTVLRPQHRTIRSSRSQRRRRKGS
jgi:hypothetical protein